MAKYKVVHYINQFYAGMGGEDTASVGISVRDGAVGQISEGIMRL